MVMYLTLYLSAALASISHSVENLAILSLRDCLQISFLPGKT